MANYAMGWVKQPKDDRDYRLEFADAVSLPETIDLTPKMGPQLDQMAVGACGAFTAAEMISYDQADQGMPIITPSQLFIYWNCRQLMGTIGQDSGVENRALLKSLSQTGFCDESLWTYDGSPAMPNGNFPHGAKAAQKPPQDCYAKALDNLISYYAAISVNLSQMQPCLASGRPFMFGFPVFPSFMTDEVAETGIVPDPGTHESQVGGHDICACGWSAVARPGIEPGKIWPAGTFRMRNHWRRSDGRPWGDAGHAYLSAKYALMGSDFWVINAIPTVIPLPPAPAIL